VKTRIVALAVALVVSATTTQAATFALPGFSGSGDIAGPITGTQTIFLSFAVDATIQMPRMDSQWHGFVRADSALSMHPMKSAGAWLACALAWAPASQRDNLFRLPSDGIPCFGRDDSDAS
jgi:hypothetical protein